METKRNVLPIIYITLAIIGTLLTSAVATMEDDVKDCADELANMASCIPYVSGTAKQPTKQCCTDTEKVRSVKPKCLCVLIKESSDPSLGLPINTTLALQMPEACKSDAKISECPKLLNIPADSPDAKIFKLANADSSTASSTTTTPSSAAATTSTPSSTSTSADTKTTSASSSSSGAKIASSILLVVGLVSISLVLV